MEVMKLQNNSSSYLAELKGVTHKTNLVPYV